MDDLLKQAAARHFPPYLLTERACSPANSSPFRMTRADLHDAFGKDGWRMNLLVRLDRWLDDLAGEHADFPAVLIGGGFIRRLGSLRQPSDIDALVFYRLRAGVPGNLIERLKETGPKAKLQKMDLRFCPLDVDPLEMIQIIAFFSTLYSKREGSRRIENGLILYDRLLAK